MPHRGHLGISNNLQSENGIQPLRTRIWNTTIATHKFPDSLFHKPSPEGLQFRKVSRGQNLGSTSTS